MPDALAVEETASTCRMRGTDLAEPRCTALEGVVGVQVSCSIYGQRPDPCHEFTAHGLFGISNGDCSRVRRRHGLAPLEAPDWLL